MRSCQPSENSVSASSPTAHSDAAFSPDASRAWRTCRENDTRSARFPRFAKENFQKNVELADRIREIADDKGVAPGQLALAWLLAQGEDIVPIPGTKRRKYLEENAGAADVTLTDEDLARIEEALPRGSVAGERYTEEMMRAVGR